MKKAFVISVIVVIVIVAIIVINRDNQDNQPITPNILQPASKQQANNEVKSFSMTARQWEFEPNTITVNRGDRVSIAIKSIDVEHGIGIPDFGVSSMLSPGQTTDIEFIADKTGTFTFFCNVYCGQGHGNMKGTLIVQ